MEFLQTENRFLTEVLRGKRVCFTAGERALLMRKVEVVGRRDRGVHKSMNCFILGKKTGYLVWSSMDGKGRWVDNAFLEMRQAA